jgi:hypothetical protein
MSLPIPGGILTKQILLLPWQRGRKGCPNVHRTNRRWETNPLQSHLHQFRQVLWRSGRLEQAYGTINVGTRLAMQSTFKPHDPSPTANQHPGHLPDQWIQDNPDRLAPRGRVLQDLLGLQLGWKLMSRNGLGHPSGHLIQPLCQTRTKPSRKILPRQPRNLANPVDAQLMQEIHSLVR